MLNVDRVWARASRRPEFRNKQLQEFGMQAIPLLYTGLASGATVSNQAQKFPNGAIILGIMGGAIQLAQAPVEQVSSGLSMFSLTLEYEQNRTLVGGAGGISGQASSVFGAMNDQFPASEIYVPTNGSLLWSFTNLTNATISIWVTHHCLVPVNVG